MSSLNKLVRERDNRMNSARQLDVTMRLPETKRICVQCRRVPDVRAMESAWKATFRTGTKPKPWPGVGDTCPECGGALVSVTW